jgi:molecular chaperone GrpE
MSDEREIQGEDDPEQPTDGGNGEAAAPVGDEAPADSPPGEAAPPAEPAPPTLEEQLDAARNEVKANREKMLRVAADYENYRKRAARQIDEARVRGLHTAVKDLLPVFDNLERATGHIDATTDPTSLADGLNMVRRQFVDTLGKLGIERVPAVGVPFDPTVHESIQYEHSTEHPAGTVTTELQPGYRASGVLLRPALVVVSRGVPAPEPPPPAAGEAPAAEAVADEPVVVVEPATEEDSGDGAS